MISPMMGAPAFPCRLIPVYSLKHDLTFQQTQKVITLIHQNGSYTFFLMTDNLTANHACFKLYREIFDPTHHEKNIRNNWQTEKNAKAKIYRCNNKQKGKSKVV